MGIMYFEKPANQKYVYSEHYQLFVPVTFLGDGRYQVSFPDGNKSYTYKNGKCIDVEVHTNWTVVNFKLSDIGSSIAEIAAGN